MDTWYRWSEETMELLRKSIYSIILSTQSRLYLILFLNAHSVCLNLHLLLALNIAWNVCAAWQKVSMWKGKAQNEVCLAKCSQTVSAPWHPSALQGERLLIVFSKSSLATVPEQIGDFYALWQYASICWNHQFVSGPLYVFACFLKAICVFWLSFFAV